MTGPGVLTPGRALPSRAARLHPYWRKGLTFAWIPRPPFGNLVTGELPSSDAFTWDSTRRGWARTGGTTGALTFSAAPGYQVHDGLRAVSMFVHIDGVVTDGANRVYMSARSSAGDGNWMYINRVANPNQLFWNDGGSFYDVLGSATNTNAGVDRLHWYGFSVDAQTNKAIFFDDDNFALDTKTDPWGSTDHTFTLGDPDYSPDLGVTAGFLAAYMWQDRALTAHDFLRLRRDPWAPLRAARRPVVRRIPISNARLADMAFAKGRMPWGFGRLPAADGAID